jgi:2-oxoglutarate dehydrogenase E2 component (dihydrolipoamide succinyltransferase)
MTELESVAGSGKDGRITKKDILAYLTNRSSAPAAAPAPKASKPAASTATVAAISAPKVPAMEGDEIIEMDRMRKMIANHMVMSKHVSPHVTSFVEADVTNIVNWRNKVKDEFFKREGEKITFTPIFVDAVVKAIKDFPMINVAVDGTNIIKRKHINVGMAAALPSGNLIVPVIKDADQKNMIGLTKAVNDLARRSRSNDLKPDEVSGGTFTLTNVGGFGNIMGTPIINQPQVAIMAVGAIVKKPAVIETDMGDVIAIRHKMFCSLSYDHRVVDGSLGGMFLKRFSDYLEAFDPNTSI